MSIPIPHDPNAILKVFQRPQSSGEVAVSGWSDLLGVLTQASTQGGGLFFVSAPPGTGKSTFLRQLTRRLDSDQKAQVIFGVLGTPMIKSGWLLRLIADSLGMEIRDQHIAHGILERLEDFATEGIGVVIVLDGIDIVGASVAASDLTGFLNLTEHSQTRITIVATGDVATCNAIKEQESLSSRYVVIHELAGFTDTEMSQFITERLKLGGIAENQGFDIPTLVRHSMGLPGKALRLILDQVTGATTKPQVVSEESSTTAKGKSVPPKNTSNKSKKKVPIDDMLTDRKSRRNK